MPNPIQFLDIDSLLDATLDDLADMPEFKPFPKGSHQATIAFEQKLIQGRASVEWKLTAIETLELVDAVNDQPVKAGDTCSGAFIFFNVDGTANDMAQSQFKALLAPLQAHFNTDKNRDTMVASQGATVVVTMSQRAGKKDTPSAGKFFPVIEALAVM